MHVAQYQKPVLGITMGDVTGIGPEIIAKVLCTREAYDLCRPVVIGSATMLRRSAKFFGESLEVRVLSDVQDASFTFGTADVLEPEDLNVESLPLGRISQEAGRAAVAFVKRAVERTLSGHIAGIVTAPLNKEAMHLAGFSYAGHTELLAELTNTSDYRMMLAAGPFRIVHVTTHVALRHVPEMIRRERVLKSIELLRNTLIRLNSEEPRVAVAGLNPHSGEAGLFGDEEQREIAPAVEMARSFGWNVSGPVPPDTVFLRAERGEFDGIVAMYHDQGHIPAKLVAFDRGVNITLGLPIVRTSVDHGTAFDIAGKGIASPNSLMEAIRLAVKLISV